MKQKNHLLLIALIVGSIGCWSRSASEKSHFSPSKVHAVDVFVGNRNNPQEPTILMLQLVNLEGGELDYLNTGASNAMKWAVAWVNDSLLILDSQDIGPSAWKVSKNGHFLETKVSESMLKISEEAFALKYHKTESR